MSVAVLEAPVANKQEDAKPLQNGDAPANIQVPTVKTASPRSRKKDAASPRVGTRPSTPRACKSPGAAGNAGPFSASPRSPKAPRSPVSKPTPAPQQPVSAAADILDVAAAKDTYVTTSAPPAEAATENGAAMQPASSPAAAAAAEADARAGSEKQPAAPMRAEDAPPAEPMDEAPRPAEGAQPSSAAAEAAAAAADSKPGARPRSAGQVPSMKALKISAPSPKPAASAPQMAAPSSPGAQPEVTTPPSAGAQPPEVQPKAEGSIQAASGGREAVPSTAAAPKDTPADVSSAEISLEAAKPAEKSSEAAKTAEKPSEAATSAEKPSEAAKSAKKPAQPAAEEQKSAQASKVPSSSKADKTAAPAAGAGKPKQAPAGPSTAPKPAAAQPSSKPPAATGAEANGKRKVLDDSDSDSDDDIPLAQRMKAQTNGKAAPSAAKKPLSGKKLQKKPAQNGALPSAKKVKQEKAEKPAKKRKAPEPESEEEDEDSEDDEPLAKRKKTVKREKKREQRTTSTPKQRRQLDRDARKGGEDKTVKWETLEHSGVLFPPEYTPHAVKMLYDGKPVNLTPEEEEVATAMAVMTGTAYLEKRQFLDNFWADWKPILGKGHVIKDLTKCDFTPIYEWHMAERERKKALPKEEKDRLKKEKDEADAKFKYALVDGRREQVGNFRVEPPGLFRGRGDHPRMGKLKARIYPRDITINIGPGVQSLEHPNPGQKWKEIRHGPGVPIPEHPYPGQKWKEIRHGPGVPIPEHPYPGQKWKEIRHDNTVTWLAYWKDPISQKDYKYVWLAANSLFKSDSDLAKYEKARKLKDYIEGIRKAYEEDWYASKVRERQMAVALYFIDKLALRAGHEKDEDEADTVGCCTLKVENVDCMEDFHIKFDFLGKDSIRYENEVQVRPRVYELVKEFCRKDEKGNRKKPENQLFETMDAGDLNKRLKELMDGLSVKVFRTYNASITLDALLHKESTASTVDERKAEYDRANKEVAILCNHQRAVPKGHTGQMQKMEAKLLEHQQQLDTLEAELLAAEKGKKYEGGKPRAADTLRRQIERKRETLAKLEINAKVKEDLKTVALGTSKINYLDPRITVAWCKMHEVPIEKIFNKSLLSKFHWSMDTPPEFCF